MVQEAETPVIELELVSCGTCDTVFISSERRQTCPACGGEAVGPYLEFIVTPEGPRLKNGAVAIARTAAPPAERIAEPELPAGDAPAVEEALESEGVAPALAEAFAVGVQSFLMGGGTRPEELEGYLLSMGATPEDAATAIGRLSAIYTLLDALTFMAGEAQEEAVAEEPPAVVGEPEASAETPVAE